MATAIKKCKVCGKEYEYCHTAKRVEGVFRWQDVACCPEHGSIYLAKIEASRSCKNTSKDLSDAKESDYVLCITEDDDDALFEEDFDDSELEETTIEK